MTDLVGMEVGRAADKTVGLSLYSTSNDAHLPRRQYKVRYIKMKKLSIYAEDMASIAVKHLHHRKYLIKLQL